MSVSLSVREITSVSVTFSLVCDEPSVLAGGISVTVNSAAWPRAFVRIDEQMDEAVIIIYALMPGRQYDVELALEGGILKSTVSTDDDDDTETEPTTPPNDEEVSSESPSLEDKLASLRTTLAQVQSERETLLVSLKTTRRDVQKSESSMKQEIDVLRRTMERNAASDVRGRQRLLALGEMVRRGRSEVEEMEMELERVEIRDDDVREREAELAALEEEAARVGRERSAIEEAEKKRVEGMRAELAGLSHRLERIAGKKEKVEKTIPDLEQQLREVEQLLETPPKTTTLSRTAPPFEPRSKISVRSYAG